MLPLYLWHSAGQVDCPWLPKMSLTMLQRVFCWLWAWECLLEEHKASPCGLFFSIKILKLILFLLLPSKFDNLMWLCPASNHDNSQLKCLGLKTLCIWVYLAHNTILLQYSSRIKDKKNYWRIWMKTRGGGLAQCFCLVCLSCIKDKAKIAHRISVCFLKTSCQRQQRVSDIKAHIFNPSISNAETGGCEF